MRPMRQLLILLAWNPILGMVIRSPFAITKTMESVLADSDSPTDKSSHSILRRQLFLSWGMMASAVGQAGVANAADPFFVQQAESVELQVGLLESRVTENVLSPPPYGMETTDVFYPIWFSGTWKVASTTSNVLAPCGVLLFGGNNTYQAALTDIGTTLIYDSRFVTDGALRCIADREYNVKSIARAAMGPNSVVDVGMATPNKFSCILAPMGSPTLLKVDLITLNRRQETVSDTQFDCSEVVREIVAPVSPTAPSAAGPPPILKEVETTSLYTYDPNKDQVTCRQRSATFLMPSQSSPMAMKMWEATRGRPVDVRFYNVRYTRK